MEIRLLEAGDGAVLESVAGGVFDRPVTPAWTAEFLADSRHHLVVAIDDGQVVGFASGVDYVHPDKPAELWINEVGVAPTHRREGLGRKLVTRLLDHGRESGCRSAWVLTERTNLAARRLYAALSGGGEGQEQLLFEFPFEARRAPAIEPE